MYRKIFGLDKYKNITLGTAMKLEDFRFTWLWIGRVNAKKNAIPQRLLVHLIKN